MDNLSKKQKKELRGLADLGYERELTFLLNGVADNIDSWRTGNINVFDLNEYIHGYHDGSSRELWKRYSGSDLLLQVLYAMKTGYITENDLPNSIRDHILNKYRDLAVLWDDDETEGGA